MLINESSSQVFITKLIVQGLLMLLETQVVVRCREKDVTVVKACLAAAQAEYTKLIKAETGATKTCSLEIDKQYLPPAPVAGKDGSSSPGLASESHSARVGAGRPRRASLLQANFV